MASEDSLSWFNLSIRHHFFSWDYPPLSAYAFIGFLLPHRLPFLFLEKRWTFIIHRYSRKLKTLTIFSIFSLRAINCLFSKFECIFWLTKVEKSWKMNFKVYGKGYRKPKGQTFLVIKIKFNSRKSLRFEDTWHVTEVISYWKCDSFS